ncbi:TRAP-type C4-dicarboxylate transport system permease small subunit [Evansella vedderi]|uniref:TRAP-type C4-dicarboxylate transport system permease small subunit n=1 Tax=Evansella vedderi TaxID=38282 RepID=A0ABU0A2D9_9BACI|nr:TRAP transporter small permease [Evansella vedderi]MDQ0257656.1 TRAP-type C4-dicarboxylate transport system permease small subunit [Evansella vedderi]
MSEIKKNNILIRALKGLDSLLIHFEKIILSWSIIIISVMTFGNVVYRSTTGRSWLFAAEVSEIAIIMATFMGISYAARKGRHISMSAFFDMAPKRVKKFLAIFNPLVTAILLFILCYYAIDYTLSQTRVTSAMQLPYWVMVMFMPIGLFLGGVQFLRNMWVNIVNEEVYLAQEKKDYDEQ